MSRHLRWVPPVAWAAFLYFLSAQSRLPGPPVPYLDKAQHFAAYLVLGFLLARAPVTVAFAAALGILYGAADEVHQMFVPGRSPSVWDWAADALGVLSGAFAYTRWLAWRGRERLSAAPREPDPLST